MENDGVSIRSLIIAAARSCTETMSNSRSASDRKALEIYKALRTLNKQYASHLQWQSVIPLAAGIIGAGASIAGAAVQVRPWLANSLKATPKMISLLGKTATQYGQGCNSLENSQIEESKHLQAQVDRMEQALGDGITSTIRQAGQLLQVTRA